MAGLTANRSTRRFGVKPNGQYTLPVADNVHIFQGAMIGVNAAGYAVPMSAALGLACVGEAQTEADNTITGHTAGGITVECWEGDWLYDIGSAGDALTATTPLGALVYAIDDHTVGLTSGSGGWGTATRVGTGVNPGMTVTGTPLGLIGNANVNVEAYMILGGAVGTATFQYSVNNGPWSATTTTAATVAIPDGLTLNFAAGTYVLGDTYSQSYSGARSLAGIFRGLDASSGLAATQAIVRIFTGARQS